MEPKDLWAHEGFECTDVDNLQYGKTNTDGTFSFKEFDRFNWPDLFKEINSGLINESVDHNQKFWYEDTINLKDYTQEQQVHYAAAYGYKIWYTRYNKNGNHYEWEDESGNLIEHAIIAECIFEQESGLY